MSVLSMSIIPAYEYEKRKNFEVVFSKSNKRQDSVFVCIAVAE